MLNWIDEIKRAIEVAEKQLAEVRDKLKEYEELTQRRSQLEAFINEGKALLGLELAERPLPTVPREPEELFREGQRLLDKPVLEGALEIFKESKRSMKLKELAQEFQRRGWKLSRQHGEEVLRLALKKRPDLFKKVSPGTFRLKVEAI